MRHLKNLFKRKSVPTLLLDSDDLGQTPRKQEPRPHPQKTAQTAVPRPDAVPPSPHDRLSIDCPDPTAEDRLCDENHQLGQGLVRQENWAALSKVIRAADADSRLTPGSMPVAELIAYGARADVVMATEHAIEDVDSGFAKALLRGIEDFEHVLDEHQDDYVVACVVAQAHIDIGWAWRGKGESNVLPQRNRDACIAHFERAGEIITPFIAQHPTSALVAATCCAHASGPFNHQGGLRESYEKLIMLNPLNPRPMRALGNHLLPRHHGGYSELELEARRTAARVQNVWGAGGYTWVMFDAICADDTACVNLDVDYFIDGLRDILAHHSTAYFANLLAAYCANMTSFGGGGNERADSIRARIGACTEWIIRAHLTELHPMIWAHAAHGFDNNLRIRSPHKFAASGREDAMQVMTSLFRSELASGQRIVFTSKGPQATPA